MDGVLRKIARLGLVIVLLVAGGCRYRVVEDDRLNESAITQIVKRTAEYRNLPFKSELPVELVDKAVLERELIQSFQAEVEPEKLDTYALLLKKLGLLDADVDLEQYLIELLTSQIAGYYDPETKVMRLVRGNSELGGSFEVLEKFLRRDLGGEFLMAHELTHALTDQHFDLRAYMEVEGNSDAVTARKAFVEGDAMLTGIHYVLRRPMQKVAYAPPSREPRQTQPQTQEDMWASAPRVIRRQIMFEYLDGLNFAVAVYRQEGTRALNRVYVKPPRSSEEVLHPEKYFAGDDAPVAVTLGDHPPEMDGLVQVDEDTMGEIGILALLEEPLGEPGARVAAAGWGGDRFRLYRDPARPDVVGFHWKSAWDSEADRIEFTANLRQAFTKVFGEPEQAKRDAAIWRTPGGVFELRDAPGAEVFLYPAAAT